jgi:hypothetical protein
MEAMDDRKQEGRNQGMQIGRHGPTPACESATRALRRFVKRSTGVASASKPSMSSSDAISDEAV